MQLALVNKTGHREHDKDFFTILVECMGFWNREGRRIYQANIDGTMGSSDTQLFAESTDFGEWLLDMIKCDMDIYSDALARTGQSNYLNCQYYFEIDEGTLDTHYIHRCDEDGIFLDPYIAKIIIGRDV